MKKEHIIQRMSGNNWRSAFSEFQSMMFPRKLEVDMRFLKKAGFAHNAEDVVQDSFLRLMNKRLKILEDVKYQESILIRYLFRINKNLCIDLLRKWGRFDRYDPDKMDIPDSKLLNPNTLIMRSQMFRKLKVHQQQILIFYYVYGMTFTEISMIIGKSIAWIWNNKKDAIESLINLSDEGEDEGE